MDEEIVVNEEEAGMRLDKFLALRFPDYSRTYFQYLIENHLILVNQEQVKKRALLKSGDEIEIEFIATPEIALTPEKIPLKILYEDEHLIAIDKPPGLVVHPGPGNWSHTFVNALLYHCQTLPGYETLRPGIVHRLDKDTSGVLIAAKTERAHQALVHLFAERKVYKQYFAICIGNPGRRTIEGNIGRHPVRRKEMAIVENGKKAITHCQTVLHDEMMSCVRLQPETGRTHQLRVHLKSIGTPILGDPVYGNAAWNKKYGVQRTLLHAEILRFEHPVTKKTIELYAPIPEDIQRFIDLIKK